MEPTAWVSPSIDLEGITPLAVATSIFSIIERGYSVKPCSVYLCEFRRISSDWILAYPLAPGRGAAFLQRPPGRGLAPGRAPVPRLPSLAPPPEGGRGPAGPRGVERGRGQHGRAGPIPRRGPHGFRTQQNGTVLLGCVTANPTKHPFCCSSRQPSVASFHRLDGIAVRAGLPPSYLKVSDCSMAWRIASLTNAVVLMSSRSAIRATSSASSRDTWAPISVRRSLSRSSRMEACRRRRSLSAT